MSKKFTGTSQGFAINPTVAKPLDIRTVVQYYSDLALMDNEVPSYTYTGMIVAVVEDENRQGGSSDNNGVYYKKNDGTWEKIGSGSVIGNQFIFSVNPIYTENSEGQYIESGSISSSTQMTLTSVYGSGDGRVSDIIAVKENEDTDKFHLMLNPEILYVLNGGDGMGANISVSSITRTTASINN